VLDHLSVHKVPGVREAVEASGVTLLYRPPYSPAFHLLSLPSGRGRDMGLGGPTPLPLERQVRRTFGLSRTDF
jgi:hypothetical protein